MTAAKSTPGESARSRRSIGGFVQHAVLIVVSIVFLFPFYWMLGSSLKTRTTVFAKPVQWIPNPAHWDNYSSVIHYPGFPFWRMLGNSFF
jgi:multiple sugar transport system permease protein